MVPGPNEVQQALVVFIGDKVESPDSVSPFYVHTRGILEWHLVLLVHVLAEVRDVHHAQVVHGVGVLVVAKNGTLTDVSLTRWHKLVAVKTNLR